MQEKIAVICHVSVIQKKKKLIKINNQKIISSDMTRESLLNKKELYCLHMVNITK